MSKRVNITYSVRFDKILETMGDMINKAYNSDYRPLNKDFDELLASISRKDEKESLQKIQAIREKLVNIDFCLNDSHGIISAYQRQLLQPEENTNNDENL